MKFELLLMAAAAALIIIAVCYLTGSLAQLIFRTERGFASRVLSGFVLLSAIFFADTIPFMFRLFDLNYLKYLLMSEIVVILILYIIFSLIRKNFSLVTDIKNACLALAATAKESWWHIIYMLAFLALMAFQIYRVIFTSDLSGNETAAQITAIMGNLDLSGTGLVLSFWETLWAASCLILGCSVSTACTIIIPLITIPLHYMALFLIGRQTGRGRIAPFLLIAALLNTCPVSVFSAPGLLNADPVSASMVLVNIIFPLVFYCFMHLVTAEKISVQYPIYVFLLIFVGTGLSGSDVLMLPAMTLALFITFIICRHKIMDILEMFIPLLFAGGFVVLKLKMSDFSFMPAEVSRFANGYINSIEQYFGNIIFIIIMIFAILVIIPRRHRNHVEGFVTKTRLFIFLSLVIMFVLFTNNFVMPYAEGLLCGAGHYPNIFRIMHPAVITAIGLADFGTLPKSKPLRVVFDLLCCVGILFITVIFR